MAEQDDKKPDNLPPQNPEAAAAAGTETPPEKTWVKDTQANPPTEGNRFWRTFERGITGERRTHL